MAATIYPLGYPRYTAKNRWPSIDGHFQNEAVTVLLTYVPRKDASTMAMDSTDQVTFQLPCLQD